MTLIDNIKQFVNERRLPIIGTVVGAVSLASVIGVNVANSTARYSFAFLSF